MRRAVLALVFVLSSLAISAQTPAPAKLDAYAGKWQSLFQGKPFFILELSMKGDKLLGTITHTRDIHVDGKGELDKVTDDMSSEQIVETKIVMGALRITGKDESEDLNNYELRLSSKDEGTLKLLLGDAPTEVPKIQPWKITRAAK